MVSEIKQIQDALIVLLKADSAVSTIVAARVYDIKPPKAQIPFLTVDSFTSTPFNTKSSQDKSYQFDVHMWGSVTDRATAFDLQQAVSDELEHVTITVGANTYTVRFYFEQLLRDPDNKHMHGITRFTATLF